MRLRIMPWLAASALALALAGCKVEQTKEGTMPDVDVQVKPGTAPEFDVKPVDVDVNMTTKTVTVPDVDVNTQEKVISVPDVDVTAPQ